MGESSPAFQFYPKDFLTDVKQIAMSLPEAGAYWRLCCHCWLAGSLPMDLQQLGRLCGATKRQMTEMWPTISPCFLERDGVLIHKRLEREREKQESYRRRQSDKGKASAASRSTKTQPDGNHGSTTVQPEAQPKLNSPISDLQSPISSLQTAVTYAPVALAGKLPRDHVKHGWCSSRGKCVPEFLHEEFIRSVGGERKSADQRLCAFYAAVEAGWAPGPIGDDPLRLWRKEFAAKFPSVAPVSGSLDRTGMLAKATREFLGQ